MENVKPQHQMQFSWTYHEICAMLVGIYNLSVRIFWPAEFLTSYGSEHLHIRKSLFCLSFIIFFAKDMSWKWMLKWMLPRIYFYQGTNWKPQSCFQSPWLIFEVCWESPLEDDSPEIRHILVIQTQKALAGEFCTVSGQCADVVLSVGVCLAEVSQHINLRKVVNEITLPTSWTMVKRNRFTEMVENWSCWSCWQLLTLRALRFLHTSPEECEWSSSWTAMKTLCNLLPDQS